MNPNKEPFRRQELIPLEYESGYQFQFVSFPSTPIPDLQSPAKHRKSKQHLEHSTEQGEISDLEGVETVFIESDGSDEEGIRKNVIIKSVHEKCPPPLIIRSKSQTSLKLNTNLKTYSIPKLPKIDKLEVPETTNNFQENQKNVPSGNEGISRPTIHYNAPVGDTQQKKLVVNKSGSTSASRKPHPTQNIRNVHNSGTFTIQHNEVNKGGHQVISSGPVIVNTPGFVSINSPVRHFMVPKDSLPNAKLNFQTVVNQNHTTSKQSSPNPNISRPVQNTVLKIIKIGPAGSSTEVYPPSPDPNIQKPSTLKVRPFSSLAENPSGSSDSIMVNQFLGQKQEKGNADKAELVDYPDFVQVYRPNCSEPTQIQGFCDNSVSLQPSSLDFQNLSKPKLIQLHAGTPKPPHIQRRAKPMLHNKNNSKQKNLETQSNRKNSQAKKWTYVEVNKDKPHIVYSEAKKANVFKEPLTTTTNKPTRKDCIVFRDYSCFRINEWKRCITDEFMAYPFLGFGLRDHKVRSCLNTLNSNINIFESKLAKQQKKLEMIQKCKKNYLKRYTNNKSSMKTFLSDDSMQTDNYLSDSSEGSETESDLEDDLLLPSTSFNKTTDDFDSNLLMTKKVVILKNGSESSMIRKKKNRKRFAPPKNYSTKKRFVESKPKERPLDYRVYMKISAMKKLHNIRRSYVEIESNPLVHRALELYKKNKKSFLKLTPEQLVTLQKEKNVKEFQDNETKQKYMFMNWFNNKIITSLEEFKRNISHQKPLLIITKANLNEVRHHKQFNIVFPAAKVLPENLPRNKEFITLVGMGYVKIVAARVLSEYFERI